MKSTLLAVAALLITACATPYDTQEIEATRDFVAATELEQVGEIRLQHRQPLNYHYLNDYFVTVDGRRADYLVEFRSKCRALNQVEFRPEMADIRHDSNVIRAKFDTIRGCHIDKIYAVSEEQREELEHLGDAPGDETFLPDEAQED